MCVCVWPRERSTREKKMESVAGDVSNTPAGTARGTNLGGMDARVKGRGTIV